MEADRHNDMKGIFLLEIPVFNAIVSTPGIDMGADGPGDGSSGESLEFIVSVGSVAITGNRIEVIPQESETGSGWDNVPDEHVIGGTDLVSVNKGIDIPIGAQNTIYRVGTVGKMRHQRLILVEVGTITAGQITVTAVVQDMRHNPQPAQNS